MGSIVKIKKCPAFFPIWGMLGVTCLQFPKYFKRLRKNQRGITKKPNLNFFPGFNQEKTAPWFLSCIKNSNLDKHTQTSTQTLKLVPNNPTEI